MNDELKFLSSVFLTGGIIMVANFANAQNMPRKIAPSPIAGIEERACIQVIAPAISPEGICKEFPTPCDVPPEWKKVSQCPASGVVPPVAPPSDPSLIAPKPMPIMPIIGDNIETDLRQELSIREIRGQIICKELDRCPLSEAKSSTEVSIKSAKVTEIGADYLKISVFSYAYKVNISNAKIIRTSGISLAIKELTIGDIVNIAGSLDGADNYLINASIVKNVSISKKQDIFVGTIGNIMKPDAFILNTDIGSGTTRDSATGSATTGAGMAISASKKLTVIVGANTEIIKTGMPGPCKTSPCPLMMRPDLLETKGTFSDLKTGMQVTVRGILDKTSSKIEAQLIILKGYKVTEMNGKEVKGEIIKPEIQNIDPQKNGETKVINGTGTSVQPPPLMPSSSPVITKTGLWENIIKSLFGGR